MEATQTNPEEEKAVFKTEDGEDIEYEMPYASYIEAAYNALLAVDDADSMTKENTKRIESIRKRALYLIDKSMEMLVKEFDSLHKD